MIDGVYSERVQTVRRKTRYPRSEIRVQARILSDICRVEADQVIVPSRKHLLELCIRCQIRIDIFWPGYRSRRGPHVHAVSAELEETVSNRLLPRSSPVRRRALNIEIEVCSRIWQWLPQMRRTINCCCAVQVVIPHRVAAKPRHILSERSIDNRRCGRRRSRWRHDPWKPPGRRIVPQILNRGIVVDVQSIHERLAFHQSVVRVSNVRVVPAEVIRLRIIRRLYESADVAAIRSGQEQ